MNATHLGGEVDGPRLRTNFSTKFCDPPLVGRVHCVHGSYGGVVRRTSRLFCVFSPLIVIDFPNISIFCSWKRGAAPRVQPKAAAHPQ